ncbi:MAG: class I SAM-dependent methyltransferase [Paenibacillus sp.]|uniref:class I SAM-dependent methyltransferase n=1 Tax=Paenibacillus sp. TaxID=58172 RepID=UPI002906709E|nr:class I SAM-dependent methyltransferase [Paenibacillus sp.]MDU4696489.1 class I SAM-dependent methyltransferase [Paenibacillus sp.]
MASHNEFYLNQADAYEFMISKQPELAGIVNEVRPYKNLDVLDLGAGSGKLSSFIAKEAKSLICTDQSSSMLQLLNDKLKQQGLPQLWSTIEADHRNLPIPDSTIDLVVSGWSICYLANTNNEIGKQI